MSLKRMYSAVRINEIIQPKKIAILAWGSLPRRPDKKFDKWHHGWIHDGPKLKLEFSHIAKMDDNALTLVIDEKHGEVNKVEYCISKRTDLDKAIHDLQRRERTIPKDIGVYPSKKFEKTNPDAYHAIETWAKKHKIDCVIWTDLPPNFKHKTGKIFNKEHVKEYIESLTEKEKKDAFKYAKNAPRFIKTKLRKMIEDWANEKT